MPLTVAQGPLGLLGVHTWNGGLALNDLMSPLPGSKARAIRGWHSLPEADNNTEPRTGRAGESLYPGYPRGRTFVYEMTALASDALELYAYMESLRGQFQERSSPGVMEVAPNPGLGSVTWKYNARILDFQADDEITTSIDDVPTPYQLAYTLTVRQYEGSFFLPTAVTGGSYNSGETHTLVNEGNCVSDAVITGEITSTGITTIDIENLSITNPRTGTTVLLELYAPLNSDWGSTGFPTGTVTVDFANRRATLDDGAGTIYSLAGVVYTYYSNWWEERIPSVVPGNNDFKVTNLSNWDVSFYSRNV